MRRYSVIACLRRRCTHGVTFQKRKIFEFRVLFMQIVPSREKVLILVNRHLGKKNRKRIEEITLPASVELKK